MYFNLYFFFYKKPNAVNQISELDFEGAGNCTKGTIFFRISLFKGIIKIDISNFRGLNTKLRFGKEVKVAFKQDPNKKLDF